MSKDEVVEALIEKFNIQYTFAIRLYNDLEKRNELSSFPLILDKLDTFEDLYDYYYV